MRTGKGGVLVLAVVLAGGFAMLNALGPLVMGIVARVGAKRAKTAVALVAARRVIDAPKTAWRSVGGVALATFIAALTASIAVFTTAGASTPEDARLFSDMATGGFLTLTIAGVVAAVSTGVMQAGSVIDRREEYRALHLAGTDLRALDLARVRETAVPLAAGVTIATGASLIFLLPARGVGVVTSPAAVLRFGVRVAGAGALALRGSLACRGVVRQVRARPRRAPGPPGESAFWPAPAQPRARRRARAAHTTSCNWWKMITGTATVAAAAAGKITSAIGNPVAKDFFDPHISRAMRSPRGRRNALPPHQVLASSTLSSSPLSTSSATSISQETWLHTPSAVAEATAPNTIRITVPCSSTLVTGRWARTQRPKNGCSNWPTTNGSSNCSSTA